VKGKGSDEFSIGEESMNTLLEEATPTPVDFDTGEIVALAMHFHSKKKTMQSTFNPLSWIHPLKFGLLTFDQNHSAPQHLYARIERHTTKLLCIASSKLKECSKFSVNKV
jgi:hypothetical protein